MRIRRSGALASHRPARNTGGQKRSPMERTAPRVSVVMPVYNGAAFLDAAIDSVLSQSVSDLELIIVDDGSTDRTPVILDRWDSRDVRISILRKANSGISDTLNMGLQAARAAWIARLDADDLMLPRRLERQLAFVGDNPDIAAAGSYFDIIDATGRRHNTIAPLPRTREELARFLAGREPLSFTHPTMIYRRDDALALGGYRRAFEPCEDVDLFARMLATGAAILIQPEVLTLYRVHAGSISRRRAAEQVTKLRYIFHNFYAERDGEAPISYDAFLRRQAELPLAAKLKLRLAFASDCLYRAYTAANLEGRKGLALLLLGVASSLRPVRAVRRGLRTLASTPRSAGS